VVFADTSPALVIYLRFTMSYIWIYTKDKSAYINIMNDMCGGPVIHKETEQKLQVDFCSAAITAWANAGFWFGSE